MDYVAHKPPLFMGLSRKESWSGFLCSSPAGLSHSGMEPMTLTSPALADGFFTTSTTWEAQTCLIRNNKGGRLIAMQAYLKKQEKSQRNNLTLHLKQIEKEEMKDPRVSRRKEILKIRAEINAKETKETTAKINKAKSWFFERVNKIDKPLARLIKKQREKNQIN